MVLCSTHNLEKNNRLVMELLGLFFLGVPISVVALYIILKNMDSNYNERMDDKDSDNFI